MTGPEVRYLRSINGGPPIDERLIEARAAQERLHAERQALERKRRQRAARAARKALRRQS